MKVASIAHSSPQRSGVPKNTSAPMNCPTQTPLLTPSGHDARHFHHCSRPKLPLYRGPLTRCRIPSGLPFWTTNILVVDLAHSLCLPRGELKEKVSSMVAERFQMPSDLKTEAQQMLNSYLAASALYGEWRWEPAIGLRRTKRFGSPGLNSLTTSLPPKPRPLR